LPRGLSDAEVKRCLAIVKKPRDLAMLALMLYAGLQVMGRRRKERVLYLCQEAYPPLAQYLWQRIPADPQVPLFCNRFVKPISSSPAATLVSWPCAARDLG